MPVILSRGEVRALLAQLDGLPALLAALLYGTGLRLMECVRLRVKDLDLDRGEILVRQGKGGKDRVTMVPRSLVSPLRRQLARARAVWAADRAAGLPGVELPRGTRRQVPARRRVVGLVLGISGIRAIARPALGRPAASSPA